MSTESEPETSGRRRFLRKTVGLAAAGGIASLLYGGATQKPLVELAQAASGGNLIIDAANDGESGTTSLSSSGNPALLGINTGSGAAIQGTSSVGTGVLGTTADGIGVSGVTSGSGIGVQGWAIAESGVGVEGIANAPNTAGVRGLATASSGEYTAGVEGYASGTDGWVNGVYGHADSPYGVGVWGVGETGVWGDTWSTTGGVGVGGMAHATSGDNAGVYGASINPNGVAVQGNARASGCIGVFGSAASGFPDAIPFLAWGTSGQTASLQEWGRRDLGTLAVVDASGKLGVGTGSPSQKLHVAGGTVRVENSAACGFDIRNTNASFDASLSVGSAGNTNLYANWTASTNLQTDTSKPSWSVRLRVDLDEAHIWRKASGGGAISTPLKITGAGELLPNANEAGSIGTASTHWGDIYVKNQHTGDLVYENGVRSTEDGDGVAFYNPQGMKIARLDAKGNFYIKGKLIEDL